MPPTDPPAHSDPPPVRDWPAYWLVCLERAIAEGDYSAAARAQQELRRLSIEVTIRPVPRQETAHA